MAIANSFSDFLKTLLEIEGCDEVEAVGPAEEENGDADEEEEEEEATVCETLADDDGNVFVESGDGMSVD